MSYRRKSIPIEAFQFCPSDGFPFPQWFADAVTEGKVKLIECRCSACRDRGRYEITKCTIYDRYADPHECVEGEMILLREDKDIVIMPSDVFEERYEEI